MLRLYEDIDFLIESRNFAGISDTRFNTSLIVIKWGVPSIVYRGLIMIKGGETMRKADKKSVVIQIGNVTLSNCNINCSCKVSFVGKIFSKIVVLTIVVLSATALVVSLCCPEHLADYIRFIVSIVASI